MSNLVRARVAASGGFAAVLTLVALSGCGSDADSAGDDPSRQDAAMTETTSTTASSPDPGPGSIEQPPGSPEASTEPVETAPHPFCDAVTPEEYAMLLDAVNSPESAEAGVAVLDRVLDEAPTSIRPDLRTITDAFAEIATVEDPADHIAGVDVDALQSAYVDVQKWEDANC